MPKQKSKDNHPQLNHTTKVRSALVRMLDGTPRKTIIRSGGITKSSLSRGIRSALKGYNIGESGHRQKLSNVDEAVLEEWILELIRRGETVLPCTVIQLVFLFTITNEIIIFY